MRWAFFFIMVSLGAAEIYEQTVDKVDASQQCLASNGCMEDSTEFQAKSNGDYTSVLQLSVSVDRNRGKPFATSDASHTGVPSKGEHEGVQKASVDPRTVEDMPELKRLGDMPKEMLEDKTPGNIVADSTPHELNEEAPLTPLETLDASSHRIWLKVKRSVNRLITQAQTQSSFMPWAIGLGIVTIVICAVIFFQAPQESHSRQPATRTTYSYQSTYLARQPYQQERLPVVEQVSRRSLSPVNYPASNTYYTGRGSIQSGAPSIMPQRGTINPGQASVYTSQVPRQPQGSIYRTQASGMDGGGTSYPGQLVEVERPSYDATPRPTPTFHEASRTIQENLANLPKMMSFSHGLQGPFEIDLGPLRKSRNPDLPCEIDTPIMERSNRQTGSTVSCNLDSVLIIKSGGNAIVKCGPPEVSAGNKKAIQIRGTTEQVWGTLKPHGMDRDNVYWYIADPDYSGGGMMGGTRRPEIHIGHIDDSHGRLMVCIFDPVSESLPPRKPPTKARAKELQVAEASTMGDKFDVTFATNVEPWLKVLILSLLISVQVFQELRTGVSMDTGMFGFYN